MSPKWVPQMADADQMVAGIKRVPGVAYEAIWLNEAGLERAAKLRDSLALRPMFSVAGHRHVHAQEHQPHGRRAMAELPGWAARYQKLGMDWIDVGVMAAFGCNYEGDVEPKHVVTRPRRRSKQQGECLRLASRQHQPRRHDGLGEPAADQAPGRRRPRPLAEHPDQAPPARHARARRRQRRRRARDRRGPLRHRGGRHGRLPVRRPQGRRRQRHHRGRGVPLPGDGRGDRHRSRPR